MDRALILNYIKKENYKIILGTVLGTALGIWYYSDVASRNHSPSTIKPPPDQDLENGLYFKNRLNMWIHTKKWEVEEPKGIIFIIHGHGEHCSRSGYDHFANQLNQVGYAVFSLDHQGHGKSNGSRAHVRSIDDLCDDFEQYYHIVTNQYPSIPCFAIGHSMGGLILLNSVLRKKVEFYGIILSAPATLYQVNSFFFKFISYTIFPFFPKFPAFRLPIDGISRNSQAREDYLKDPLICKGVLNLSSIKAMIEATKNLDLEKITLPVLIVHGANDTIVHPENSKILYNGIKSSDKEILLIPDVRHELWEDQDRDNIEAQLIDWLQRRN